MKPVGCCKKILYLLCVTQFVLWGGIAVSMEDVKINISSFLEKTDYEGQLKEKTSFYFIKLKYNDNFFSFNIPAEDFKKLSEEQRKKLAGTLLGLYSQIFTAFNDIFKYIPKDYNFNITFGKTRSNVSFNKIYLEGKTSNIFPNFFPYKDGQDVLTLPEKRILFHEIGHSLFAILIGSLEHPRMKAIEEGFVEYIAREKLKEELYAEDQIHKIPLEQGEAKKMAGLTQLDIETSIWGKEIALRPSEHKGYLGVTHHMFGVEFIKAFLEVFGREDLNEFLIRLKSVEDAPSDDFGTSEIKNILKKMGYSEEKIRDFEEKLHESLKNNVFKE